MLLVTVKRATWFRGQGPEHSRLLTTEKAPRRCCLGFAAQALRFPDSVLSNVTNLWSIPVMCDASWRPQQRHPVFIALSAHSTPDLPITARYGCQPRNIQHLLILINDDRGLPDDEREAYLTRYGELAGIAFTFED